MFCHDGVPTINETDITVEQVVCTKDQNDGKWMKVDHDQFGVPKKESLPNGHIYCDKDPDDSKDDDETCPLIKESYSISEEVIVKCSLDTCVFDCPEGNFVRDSYHVLEYSRTNQKSIFILATDN